MGKKKSNKQEVKEEKIDTSMCDDAEPEEQTEPEDNATYIYRIPDDAPVEQVFVPDNEKIERVKKQVRADRITKDRIVLDYWLRHELQLGTSQIRKLWNKMDEVYRV